MNSKTIRTHSVITLVIIFVLALAFMCSFAEDACAKTKTVKPSGKKDSTDVKRIHSALKKYSVVKLKKGKKYYLASPIHVKSNRTIDATGAVIKCKHNILYQDIKKTNYGSLKNFTIKGGVWKSTSKAGFKGSSIAFIHAQNIKVIGMKIKNTNYNGHALEFVACKDVLVDGVKITPKGAARKSQEAMVQFDIATGATYPRLKGTKRANGAICKNITMTGCTVKGNRAVATGYAYKDSKYLNKAHTNIKLNKNTLTSVNAEGAFLVNVKSATVTGNKITSKYKSTSSDKGTGLHILSVGKITDTNYTVTGNTIKGYKYGLRAYSQSSVRLHLLTLENNKRYCKRGKDSALRADYKYLDELVDNNNEFYKWNV